MLMLQSIVENRSPEDLSRKVLEGSGTPARKAAEVTLSPSHDTYDSDIHDVSTVASIEVYTKKRSQHEQTVINDGGDFDPEAEERNAGKSKVMPWHFHSTSSHIYFISLFAVFGTVVRIFAGRLFGLDCDPQTAVNDFLLPLSKQICITSSGKFRRGGALFTDLPTNMVGSFIIGVLSPIVLDSNPLPWFRSDHPLQNHQALFAALVTGLCGCLTTFASWNTQMVAMLDGSETEFGSQAGAALFGYLIGICAAVASFASGRHCHAWFRIRHKQDQDEEKGLVTESHCGPVSPFVTLKIAPVLLFVVLLSLFLLGDLFYGVQFYRKVWVSVLLTPLGALLRWRLSRLNEKTIWKRFEWMPWGTLLVNIMASLVSITSEAIQTRYNVKNVSVLAVLQAVEVGFAGSLSTVSTMVREMHAMENSWHSYVYALFTIFPSMMFGVLVYSSMVQLS